jgi:radical SAM protein with 4Fe4S-binding SPASM domain
VRPPPLDCWWELTRSCAGRCIHCRTSAGTPVEGELSLHEARRVADELAALGVRLVVLTGGEPTRFDGWDEIAARLPRVRLAVSSLSATELARARAAGVAEFAISLDGPERVHEQLRPGARWASAIEAISRLARADLDVRVVTAVCALNEGTLDALYELVRDLGVRRWQVQLVQPLGRAAGHPLARASLEAPEAILRVLLRAAREGRVEAPLHCSVGYLVPEEAVLRGRSGGAPTWLGSRAGITGFAITAAGRITGCACLPDSFAVADVRSRSLADVWSDDACFPYTRQWDPDTLGGACAGCALASICRGGCLGVAYGATGTIGANPYCLRVTRERVRA